MFVFRSRSRAARELGHLSVRALCTSADRQVACYHIGLTAQTFFSKLLSGSMILLMITIRLGMILQNI